jgi:hypothetical protein
MRRSLRAVGLSLAPLAGLVLTAGVACAGLPATPKAPPAEGATCGSYGTTVEFVDSPAEAAKIAKKEGKLVFVLHVSGNFEDPRFT